MTNENIGYWDREPALGMMIMEVSGPMVNELFRHECTIAKISHVLTKKDGVVQHYTVRHAHTGDTMPCAFTLEGLHKNFAPIATQELYVPAPAPKKKQSSIPVIFFTMGMITGLIISLLALAV
jgi:hypothetical protein